MTRRGFRLIAQERLRQLRGGVSTLVYTPPLQALPDKQCLLPAPEFSLLT